MTIKKIEALQSYNCKRHRHPKGCYFQDLPAWQRSIAWKWFDFFVARHRQRTGGQPLESWRRAIFVGLARRLARKPFDSQQGRSMRARKAGLAAQRKYRAEGRNPLAVYNADRKADIHRRQITESAPGWPADTIGGSPEKAVGKSKPPEKIQFSPDTITICGKVRGSKPVDIFNEIAKQVISRISSDERFRGNVGFQPSVWDFQIFLTPVS